VKDGKVWIEWDGTSPSITEALIERGMAREDMVLNGQSPAVRALMDAQASHA
jgi:hypothetical protein